DILFGGSSLNKERIKGLTYVYLFHKENVTKVKVPREYLNFINPQNKNKAIISIRQQLSRQIMRIFPTNSEIIAKLKVSYPVKELKSTFKQIQDVFINNDKIILSSPRGNSKNKIYYSEMFFDSTDFTDIEYSTISDSIQSLSNINSVDWELCETIDVLGQKIVNYNEPEIKSQIPPMVGEIDSNDNQNVCIIFNKIERIILLLPLKENEIVKLTYYVEKVDPDLLRKLGSIYIKLNLKSAYSSHYHLPESKPFVEEKLVFESYFPRSQFADFTIEDFEKELSEVPLIQYVTMEEVGI
ncbi:MAG: hypothetical protein ACW99A_22110, partial [Candidatus Kariarchaeaceae archaeon]